MEATLRNIVKEKPSFHENNNVCRRYFRLPPGENRQVEGGLRLQGKYKKGTEKEPLVSIITVCLNTRPTIEESIQSVLNQTYSNIEYIIIDGGSKDGTLDVIDRYKGFVDYYLSERDSGLYNAMNKGLSLASGDYIMILNSDDWYSNDCVESLVKAKIYSGADFTCALAQYVDKNGKFLYVLEHMPYDDSVRFGMSLRHELMLISSDIYNKIGYYKEEYRIIADFHLSIQLYNAGYTLYELQRPLLFFRTSGVSNVNQQQHINERFALIKEQFPYMEDGDVQLLSNAREIKGEHVSRILGKYSDRPGLVHSLQAYSIRRKFDVKFTMPEAKTVKKPYVSVVIPVHNAAGSLKRCLDAVLAQSLKEIEVICVNDASSDGSQAIIDRYRQQDPRVVSVINQSNLGPGPSRNEGIRRAKGPFAFFLDSDDTIPPNALETLYQRAMELGSDMVKGSYLRFFGSSTQGRMGTPVSWNLPLINTSLRETNALLGTTEGHWSYLYKTDLVKRVWYPPRFRVGEDSIFLVKALLEAKKVTVIGDVIYHYIENQSSAMSNFSYSKYLDAMEWRRRAWHLLNDAQLTHVGNHLLQSYWSESFFRNMPSLLGREEIRNVFDTYRGIIRETGIVPSNEKTTPFLKSLFELLMMNQDKKAYEQLRNGKSTPQPKTGAIPKTTWPKEGRERVAPASGSGKEQQVDTTARIEIMEDATPVVHWNDSTRTLLTSVSAAAAMSEPPNPRSDRLPEKLPHPLKILTFCTFDSGGAGTGTQRRLSALRANGMNAKLASLSVQSLKPYVGRIQPVVRSINTANQGEVWKLINEVAVFRARRVPGYRAKELFSLTDSVLDMRQLVPLLDRFDILHLHWVVGMLDYANMSSVLRGRPVAWTLADMNAFTGGCHYSEGCREFTRECAKCPLLGGHSDLAHEQWKIKKRAYEGLDIQFIFPSKWLAELARSSSLIGEKQLHVIPNAYPVSRLTPVNRAEARKRLGLPAEKKLLLFGADSLTNFRKGGDLLQKAIQSFRARYKRSDVEAVTFGNGNLSLGIPVHGLGYIKGEESLSQAYSAADAYVFTSREDNAPLTVGESLLCGTPVVGFPVGNLPDLLEHRSTGYLAKYLDADDIATGIDWALHAAPKDQEIGNRCRQAALRHHNPKVAAERHRALYENMLRGHGKEALPKKSATVPSPAPSKAPDPDFSSSNLLALAAEINRSKTVEARVADIFILGCGSRLAANSSAFLAGYEAHEEIRSAYKRAMSSCRREYSESMLQALEIKRVKLGK